MSSSTMTAAGCCGPRPAGDRATWATEALDEVRRQAWNDAWRAGQTKGHSYGYGVRVATGLRMAETLLRKHSALIPCATRRVLGNATSP